MDTLLTQGRDAGEFTLAHNSQMLATVFVGAFDGLKSTLEATGETSAEAFRRSASALSEMIDSTLSQP